jgi:hypothetical protein
VVSPDSVPAAGERAAAATASVRPSGPPDTTVSLPETTAPEQLLLTWGADPATQVTVSWSAPGSVPMPAAALAYDTKPITAENRGTTIRLPDPRPLDVTKSYEDASSVSFTDGLNGQTTFYYHVQLRDLAPGTTYFYQVSDGATPTPSTAGASFLTAPGGRARFRFSSYGDLGTPSFDLSPSGYQWQQSCDNAYYAVSAIEDPGDGDGPPLFHLLNGDVSYANLDYQNAPAVWRDFGINIARSASHRPWMPVLGNHETEFGACDQRGRPGSAPGGIRAQGAAGNYWNGPYGYGHYLSRFLLPDNGVVNHDGNRLRGNFYGFRVGTVQFIALDADDVIYQDSGATNIIGRPGPHTLETTSGARIPNGTSAYNHAYTGRLSVPPGSGAAVPFESTGTPNLQTLWLERTLKAAREDDGIDMIVVFMHQCAMSSAQANGSDLGIRRAWLPLFDRYQVDLVLSGHEHNYERTFPVRGVDAGLHGIVVNAGRGQARGDAVDTLRPSVVTTEPRTHDGLPAWDTEHGTVFLVLGSGGTNCPSNVHRTNPDTGLPRAKVTTRRNETAGSALTGFRRSGADSIEDAPWSAAVNATDAYGYAIFDVDPGQRPGETTITFQFFAIPAVTGESVRSTDARLHDGTTTLPTKPYETCVFGRGLGRRVG